MVRPASTLNLCLLPVCVLLAACGGGDKPSVSAIDVTVRAGNLTSPVATLEITVRRDAMSVATTVRRSGDQPVTFPVTRQIAVPFAAGPVTVSATALDREGSRTAGAEGEVLLPASGAIAVTLELTTEGGGSRRHGGGAIAGQPDLDAGAPATPDAPTAAPDTPTAAPDATPPDGLIEPTPQCTDRTRIIAAEAVVTLDYGPPPRDPKTSTVTAEAGLDHDHFHDYTGWMRFDLKEIRSDARLVSARIFLTPITASTIPPPLAMVHSTSDNWSYGSVSSNNPDAISRGARVSSDLGFPAPRRAPYAIDVARYRPLWPADLTDGKVTFGMICTTPPMLPDTWVEFEGLGSAAPALELVTCE